MELVLAEHVGETANPLRWGVACRGPGTSSPPAPAPVPASPGKRPMGPSPLRLGSQRWLCVTSAASSRVKLFNNHKSVLGPSSNGQAPSWAFYLHIAWRAACSQGFAHPLGRIQHQPETSRLKLSRCMWKEPPGHERGGREVFVLMAVLV